MTMSAVFKSVLMIPEWDCMQSSDKDGVCGGARSNLTFNVSTRPCRKLLPVLARTKKVLPPKIPIHSQSVIDPRKTAG